jgi:UMF1 family MFS transporter
MAALFFATEGMSAIMRFCAIFVKTELGISLSTIAILMLGAQLLAFPFTGLSGVVSKKIGVRITIMTSLVLWILISIFFYMASTLEHIVLISILLSLVMGSTRSLLRGTMAHLVPPAKTGFFYFIWGLANKTGSLFGPFLFGIMATVFDIRVAFLSLIPFFLIAIWTVKKMGSSRDIL